MLKTFWNAALSPLLRRPARFQVAALCFRKGPDGPEILMITSRDTGRWILPKGWPKPGLNAEGTACEEAWEEAGVRAKKAPARKIGQYHYDKRLKGGVPVLTEVDVYAVEVENLHKTFPEMSERTRRWMSPPEAAAAVDEPDLKELLENLPSDLGT
ncbi:8-oxo-dGTP pyrophosphatase MutT (NUDIX family) [Rhodovulum bhavnagarense]|uniref:8-oxo-dGTP pyrophosphatase MutT (NUDIX family) n=1 Tax=Rhodovulum bhavnagarense TaxID=992286 RepID=A0A4R2RC16_9RHOB|nr:NUDIX hydrolase [Rhodovulum bhavnagarense]TCP60333.1 8-oxo-dGTP pyrophosphatase MutT (NUDIX family) [Rhodovulum bhavnagarense]